MSEDEIGQLIVFIDRTGRSSTPAMAVDSLAYNTREFMKDASLGAGFLGLILPVRVCSLDQQNST